MKPTNTVSVRQYEHSSQKNETTEHELRIHNTFPKTKFFWSSLHFSMSSANFTKYFSK